MAGNWVSATHFQTDRDAIMAEMGTIREEMAFREDSNLNGRIMMFQI